MFFYLKFFLKCPSLLGFSFPYYNIPRKIRELQRIATSTRNLCNYNIPRKIRFLRYLYFNTAWVDFQYYTGYFSALLTYFTIANSRHETTKAGLAIHLKIHIKVVPNSFQAEFFICKLLLISFFIYAML